MKTQVWDLPLRMFHWLLAVAVVAAIVTAKVPGLMDWHARIGGGIMGLLIFRLAWGFVGSQHARFASFFPTPARLGAYFSGRWQGAGHTPLGALAVVALLVILTIQVGTGLFASDDTDLRGPLQGLVSFAVSERATHWHELSYNVLACMLGLHLGAIAYYWRARNLNLVLPMITGHQPCSPLAATHRETGKIWRAAVVAALSYTLVAGTFTFSALRNTNTHSEPAATADW